MSKELDYIKSLDKEFITPKQAAAVLHCDPYLLNIRVKQNPHNPDCLGFPFEMLGNRLRILRLPFIRYVEGEQRTGGLAPEELDALADRIVERIVERLGVAIPSAS